MKINKRFLLHFKNKKNKMMLYNGENSFSFFLKKKKKMRKMERKNRREKKGRKFLYGTIFKMQVISPYILVH